MSDREKMQHFLLVFDHRVGELVDVPQEFTDVSDATNAYAATESQYTTDDLVEVVLVGSDSLETVRATHANYFDGTVSLQRLLAQMLSAAPAD